MHAYERKRIQGIIQKANNNDIELCFTEQKCNLFHRKGISNWTFGVPNYSKKNFNCPIIHEANP